MRLSEAQNELSALYQVEEKNFRVAKPGDKWDGCWILFAEWDYWAVKLSVQPPDS